MNIPKYKGRPLILFPDDWKHRWMDPARPATFVNDWTLRDWAEFREDYYLGIRLSPFGYDDSDRTHGVTHFSGDFGRAFAPHGLTKYRIPKLHPDDSDNE